MRCRSLLSPPEDLLAAYRCPLLLLSRRRLDLATLHYLEGMVHPDLVTLDFIKVKEKIPYLLLRDKIPCTSGFVI